MMKATLLWLGAGLAAMPALALATPHRPADDAVIVETLPVRYDPQLAALRDLRNAAREHPHELQPNLQLAEAYIQASRRDGDPRFLGYAQATLSAWPDDATTPAEVRMLRATALQSLHQFDAALKELDAALTARSGYAQALLTRATVLQVRGRFSEARRDCAALLGSAGEVAAELCLGGVASVTGQLDQAASLAERARRGMSPEDATLQLWAYTLQAETAIRRGELSVAAATLAAAIKVDPDDRYARATYCDVLLDLGQPERVLELTADLTRDDNLLLRHALALQALAERFPVQAGWKQQRDDALRQLQLRHQAAALRGDRTHLREQARMVLFLQREARPALQLARENWAIQREPADARILLEAARAANDGTARDAVAAWMKSSGLVDAQLTALLEAMKS